MPAVYGAGTAGAFHEIMPIFGFDFVTANIAADSIFDNHSYSSFVSSVLNRTPIRIPSINPDFWWLRQRVQTGYLIENRLPAEVDVRSAVIRLITRKTCETSYPNTRDPKVLKMKEQADAATSSNRDAAEHIWTTLTQILTNVAGFVSNVKSNPPSLSVLSIHQILSEGLCLNSLRRLLLMVTTSAFMLFSRILPSECRRCAGLLPP